LKTYPTVQFLTPCRIVVLLRLWYWYLLSKEFTKVAHLVHLFHSSSIT